MEKVYNQLIIEMNKLLLKVNAKKSGLMRISTDAYVWLKTGIPIVKYYKYLGIVFDEKMNFKKYIKDVKDK